MVTPTMWALSTSNVGTFDHVGKFNLAHEHIWTIMWATLTSYVGSINLHVGKLD